MKATSHPLADHATVANKTGSSLNTNLGDDPRTPGQRVGQHAYSQRQHERSNRMLNPTDPKRGRSGRPWRRIRAQLLATTDVCWLCGHHGSQSIDHVIPLSKGGHPTSLDNLRPAHGVEGCPTCGRKCNSARGNRMPTPASNPSRNW